MQNIHTLQCTHLQTAQTKLYAQTLYTHTGQWNETEMVELVTAEYALQASITRREYGEEVQS